VQIYYTFPTFFRKASFLEKFGIDSELEETKKLRKRH